MKEETKKLLEERGKSYGEAHVLVGVIIGVLQTPFIEMVRNAPELVHDWMQMLSKVVRILHDPYKIDSYDDLIGYAELCKSIINGKGVSDDSSTEL
jgi:hypothetical protein